MGARGEACPCRREFGSSREAEVEDPATSTKKCPGAEQGGDAFGFRL
jgi:hypothetical protein